MIFTSSSRNSFSGMNFFTEHERSKKMQKHKYVSLFKDIIIPNFQKFLQIYTKDKRFKVDLQYFNETELNKMLSKALLKQISSLELRKFRKESGLFVAEGGKTVTDLIGAGMVAERIIATEEWLDSHPFGHKTEVTIVTAEEMKRASFLRAPQGILAIFRQPQYETDYDAPKRSLCLAADNVQDPGNMGTIIRIADWFGIEDIFCSPDTVDVYNPKTVQATMGALGRVRIHYTDLPVLITSLIGATPVYGTFLDGENIYSHRLSDNGLIVMGNEGNGIGKECSSLIEERLLIPNYPTGRDTSESLNVSTATAIICAEFRRRTTASK